jgi:hypothetical protein
MGSTHFLFGTTAGLGVAAWQGWPAWQTGVAVVLSSAVAGGRFSPDLDQSWIWRKVDKVAPDESLGHGGPMRHRGLTHWWGLPAILVVALPFLPEASRWLMMALLAGWCSHLLGDVVFGKRSRNRGPGIPLAPWWWHKGLGLDTGGTAETVTRSYILPVVICWQVLSLVGVGDPVNEFVLDLFR